MDTLVQKMEELFLKYNLPEHPVSVDAICSSNPLLIKLSDEDTYLNCYLCGSENTHVGDSVYSLACGHSVHRACLEKNFEHTRNVCAKCASYALTNTLDDVSDYFINCGACIVRTDPTHTLVHQAMLPRISEDKIKSLELKDMSSSEKVDCCNHVYESEPCIQYGPCGHIMHKTCFENYLRVTSVCRGCSRALIKDEKITLQNKDGVYIQYPNGQLA